jgi:outer membrane protein assembly factor BamD
MSIRYLLKPLVLLAMVGALTGCSSMFGGDTKPAVDTKPPEVLYQEADALLKDGEYTKAAAKFEEVDREHPYSKEARAAILMSAVAYEKAGKLPESTAAARRYLTLHPGTKEAALAQHIIASAYYDRINDPSRDQSETKQALVELETLVNRYPDSRYAPLAKKRIRLSRDVLAAHEMYVGRWYMQRSEHLAAINRFRVVVTDYPRTAHVEEALMRLTECYYSLGIANEAQTAAAVLGHNFPNSKWYKDAYELLSANGLKPQEHSGSWISRAWRTAFSSSKNAEKTN